MFAIFRAHPHDDLARIGEEHMQSDLNVHDRERLRRAAAKVSTYAAIGSLLGLGLGVATAMRIRSNRLALYDAFRVVSRPTELVFANGRREPIPNLEPYLRPTLWGDAATFGAFMTGGLFLGGETGFLTGTAAAGRMMNKDPESRRRIEDAFRLFQADVLRRQLELLERRRKGERKKIGTGSAGIGEREEGEWEEGEGGEWERLKRQASGLASSLRG
ncbi:hypothetical protein B0T22DRAFT_518813 [Podospora appendiculata]|uniref:Uncharacterized protein n=1 Tax=Podospora appendiculata TaxID=314037 RepID=A0AAE1CB53_9PEZI|nr:hypothetical protein B0T22DRAFT_518813 [Podospora appendiculata]